MNIQFSNPAFLWLLLAIPWIGMLGFRSDSSLGKWRLGCVCLLRICIFIALILAMAGLQWLSPQAGMNVVFLLDRSESISKEQQAAARQYVNAIAPLKRDSDRVGVLVFGGDAGIEQMVGERVALGKIQAVVETERTDIAAAIRLGVASFPEIGQKRLVLLSDGNENLGDAHAALVSSLPLDVSLDVIPLGTQMRNDISIQQLKLPSNVKKGTTFEAKIIALADQKGQATLRLFRNDQLLGEQSVDLSEGKNVFSFPQTLTDSGFYNYDVEIIAATDKVAQNNRDTSFINVVGDPRILILSDSPQHDRPLADALRSSRLEIELIDLSGFPDSLAKLQSFDALFLSNIAAGDLGIEAMQHLETAVKDFGMGLVCVGGDQSYAAGAYRGTPLEKALPLDMELSSKKVLPSGALAMVMHGMEFNNGNQIARKVALGVLDALGPQDELGIVLWDGSERWLFPMTKVSDKKDLGTKIMGMNQGDLPSFETVMKMAKGGLERSTAHLKHMIVFSDGDPSAPSEDLMKEITANRITVSTVLIAGHAGPETMQWIAGRGKGRFYDVRSPELLPQIFIKETAVILKSAISETPFVPQIATSSEMIRGIETPLPTLLGHVATTAKGRAEVPLLTQSGDPLLAHWQYGLGRSVAFTSDARARWAKQWIGWNQYQPFWSQIAQWALRRVESTDFTSEVSIDRGKGKVSVEAIDEAGNFRNFLQLNARVIDPDGKGQSLRLSQTAPGRYEANFDAASLGAYTINLMHLENGKLRGSQMIGTSLNLSPEYQSSETRWGLLHRLAETSGGKVFSEMNTQANPFEHDRRKTHQPKDLWQWLLKWAILLFPIDVGLRRIRIDRDEWLRAFRWIRARALFWKKREELAQRDESLGALLSRRDAVRAKQEREIIQPEIWDSDSSEASDVQLVQPETKSAIQKTPPTSKKESPESNEESNEESMTSRLLSAKKRAQDKKFRR